MLNAPVSDPLYHRYYFLPIQDPQYTRKILNPLTTVIDDGRISHLLILAARNSDMFSADDLGLAEFEPPRMDNR